MTKPNLFIIGAPKCGTTALATYLDRHPDVFMCKPKEPHYFCDDFPKMRTVTDAASYEDLFKSVTKSHKIIGEASVWYLYSKAAVANAYSYNSESKVIIMLRNPVDMVYSMHSQNINSADEDVLDFKEAWLLQDNRKKYQKIPKHCREPAKLLYGEIGKLGKQVEDVLKVFPNENVELILFDDFIGDTAGVYKKVLKYLGLSEISDINFEPVNQNEVIKYRWLTVLIRRPPKSIVKFSLFVKKLLGIKRWGVIDKLVGYNMKVRSREPLSSEFRLELQAYFKSDIIHLSKIIGKDLSSWYRS